MTKKLFSLLLILITAFSISAQTMTDKLLKNLHDNKYNFIREYPSLNHLFQHCTTGAISEYRAIEETISPEVLSDMAKWINSLK